jgi:hypothetical protein
MQAIKTKYLPATDYRGSRVKATCERGSITISFSQDAKDAQEAHARAAAALVDKFIREDEKKYGKGTNAWSGRYICGSFDDSGYVFVREWLSETYYFTGEFKS